MKQRGCSGAAMELPFSQTHLARFAREQGVNIRGLFTQHREQIGKTIESLSDFLTRQTSLSKEQATLIEKTVGNFYQPGCRCASQGGVR
jgi:hypothetical protein